MYLKEFAILNDIYSKTISHNGENYINLEKLRQVTHLVENEIVQQQNKAIFHDLFNTKTKVENYLLDLPILDDDILWELSFACEKPTKWTIERNIEIIPNKNKLILFVQMNLMDCLCKF